MTQGFSKDDRLGYAINHCIGELEQVVMSLPENATDKEITQTIRKTKIAIGTLMTDVRRIECEVEGKPINLENMVGNFFNKIAKAGRDV